MHIDNKQKKNPPSGSARRVLLSSSFYYWLECNFYFVNSAVAEDRDSYAFDRCTVYADRDAVLRSSKSLRLIDRDVVLRFSGRNQDILGSVIRTQDRLYDQGIACKVNAEARKEAQQEPCGCTGQRRSDILACLGVIVLGAQSRVTADGERRLECSILILQRNFFQKFVANP